MKPIIIISLLVLLTAFSSLTAFSVTPLISEYTKAIEDSPEHMKYKFYLLRGKAYKDSGDINSALKDFSTSIMLKPSIEVYQLRGEIYLEKGRNSSAIRDFTSAIEIRPSMELYKLRGRAYLNSENYVMALSDGALIIENEPSVSESYNLMIEVCDKQGDVELGREKARKALSIDKTNKIANEFVLKYPQKITLQGEDVKRKSRTVTYEATESNVELNEPQQKQPQASIQGELQPYDDDSVTAEKNQLNRELWQIRLNGGNGARANEIKRRLWELDELWYQNTFIRYEKSGEKKLLCSKYKYRLKELERGIRSGYLDKVDKYRKQYQDGIKRNCKK